MLFHISGRGDVYMCLELDEEKEKRERGYLMFLNEGDIKVLHWY